MPYDNKTLIMKIENHWDKPPIQIWNEMQEKLDKKLVSYFSTTGDNTGNIFVYWDLACPTGKERVKVDLMYAFYDVKKGKYA